MGNSFFNEYPYTDFHELNLSWVIKELRSFATTLEQFVSINALKYADPIQWNITTQYEKNTIVIDPATGTAYISVAPVPVGVSLTNPDYWTVVFDLGSFVVRAAKNFANTYEDETTTTATQPTPAGGWLVWGDTLYKANVNITPGDSYVVDGNITHFTIEDVVGHITDLTTTDKSNLVAAINELVTVCSNITGDITTINTNIGDLTSLTTTDKSNLVAAINELVTVCTGLSANVGDLSTLTTTDKSNLVAAVNEVNGNLATEIANRIAADGLINNEIETLKESMPHVTPEQFGAIGDGTTDDTKAIQDAVDYAITNGVPVILAKEYKSSTIWINDRVEIMGGTIKGFPFRYDNIRSNLNDGTRYFQTDAPQLYNVNTFITVHGTNTQTLVVTRIENNIIYVAPCFGSNSADTVRSFSSGDVVAIHKVPFYVSKYITYSGNNDPVNGVHIHNMKIIGDQTGYMSGYDSYSDVRYNGAILAEATCDSRFNALEISNCNNFAICLLGKCERDYICDNYIHDVNVVNSSLDMTYLECAVGILLHWSERFIDSTNICTDCVIDNNIIVNCFNGVFLSAAQRCSVSNNKISGSTFCGLQLYGGDNQWGTTDCTVTGNTFTNCSLANAGSGVIILSDVYRIVLDSNTILAGGNGFYIGMAQNTIISNNSILGVTLNGIAYYNGYGIKITGNEINGSMNTSILVDMQTVGNSYLTICDNFHQGTRSLNDSAIHFSAGKRVVVMNERSAQVPSYIASASASGITLGDVLLMNCYGQTAIASSASQALLKIRTCLYGSSYTLLNNVT